MADGYGVFDGWAPDLQPGTVTYVTVEDREAAEAAATAAEATLAATVSAGTAAASSATAAATSATASASARDAAVAAASSVTAATDGTVALLITDAASATRAALDANFSGGTSDIDWAAVEARYGVGILTLDLDTPVPSGTPAGTIILRTGESAPSATVYLDDTFDRTETAQWGIAPIGGAWSGGGSHISVSASAGRISRAAGASQGMFASGIAVENVEILTCSSIETAGTFGGIQSLRGRYVSGAIYYGVRMTAFFGGTVSIQPQKGTGTFGTNVSVLSGFTSAKKVWTRLQVKTTTAGTTRIRARVWYDGGTEPTVWNFDVTDTTANHQAVSGTILWDAYTGGGEAGTLTHALWSIHGTEVVSA